MLPVYAWGMYGMFGRLADPYNFKHFCSRVSEIGIDIRSSPYRDFELLKIVQEIEQIKHPCIKFVFGASLGANNAPDVVRRVPCFIDGIFGFQASSWPGAARIPIATNCLFAHLSTNPNPLETMELGTYRWVVDNPYMTRLVITETNDPHPGDGNVQIQDAFLENMRHIMLVRQHDIPAA